MWIYMRISRRGAPYWHRGLWHLLTCLFLQTVHNSSTKMGATHPFTSFEIDGEGVAACTSFLAGKERASSYRLLSRVITLRWKLHSCDRRQRKISRAENRSKGFFFSITVYSLLHTVAVTLLALRNLWPSEIKVTACDDWLWVTYRTALERTNWLPIPLLHF